MSRRFCPCQAGGQAAIARSRIDSEDPAPSPSRVTRKRGPGHGSGQAPCGVLGEKSSANSIGCFGG
jgi:hypothetical protein